MYTHMQTPNPRSRRSFCEYLCSSSPIQLANACILLSEPVHTPETLTLTPNQSLRMVSPVLVPIPGIGLQLDGAQQSTHHLP